MAQTSGLRRMLVPGLAALGIAACSMPAAAGDTSAGQKLAASGADGVVACATCHGAQGQGMAAAGFPYLAGQGAAYLAEQLHHFASGSRGNAVMAPIAKALSDQQIADVTAYYAQLPAAFDTKTLAGHADPYPTKDAGAWLANRGDWDNDIPACVQCHGPGGVGVGTQFPALAGQSANYLKAQLSAWKEGKRDPGPLDLMGDIAKRMSDAQITAVANYFAGLPDAVQGQATATQGGAK